MTRYLTDQDMWKCGAGKGAECCAYLGSSVKGIECLRESSFKTMIEGRVEQMNAKRLPTEAFPDCQLRTDS